MYKIVVSLKKKRKKEKKLYLLFYSLDLLVSWLSSPLLG